MGIYVRDHAAVQDLTSMNGQAGENREAFAAAMGEAQANLAEDGVAVNPEKKEKKNKPEEILCLHGIPALMMQGPQLFPIKNEMTPEAVQPESGVNGPVSGGELPEMNGPSGQAAASLKEEASDAQDVAAENADWMPETELPAAKGKDALDKSSFEALQKRWEQPSDKTARPVADLSAREALNPVTGAAEQGTASWVQATSVTEDDGEKEKTLQVNAATVAAAYGGAKAVPMESMASTKETPPENNVQEENAALQVAKASVRALKRGMTEYRVRLKPEGLGEVEVTVLTKGSEISLSMRTSSEATRGLILGHADELRAELNAQEYHVSGLTVEVGMDSGNGAGFFASGEHSEPSFAQAGIREQASVPETAQPGRRAEPIRIIPRNSTINYRI